MEIPFDKRKQAAVTGATRRLKHAKRRLDVCRNDLALCRSWESLRHEATLLQANLYRIRRGMHAVAVPDWNDSGNERTISLDPLLEPHEQVEALFRKSKKWKAAVPHLEKQVEVREKACASLEMALEGLLQVQDEEALQLWLERYTPPRKSSIAKGGGEPALPYHQFYSASGLPIRVGKGAKSNDALTFRHSKGSDWWFHVSDYPGSHVVLCVAKGCDPDAEAVGDALLLALAYSKAGGEKMADVTVTQCKHVHRYGAGTPGKVQIGKHKVMPVKHDAERLRAIKQRF